MHYGDLTDSTNLIPITHDVQPDEIYNLAAQSHVQVSFDTPEYTASADGLGTLRLLEAIRILKLEEKTRSYQASTSELYGKVQETPTDRKHPFLPEKPLCRCKTLCLLDHGQLPGDIRYLRLQRHTLQPREPGPRRHLCNAQNHQGCGPHKAGHPGEVVPGEFGFKARLGTCEGLCGGHVANAAAGRA